MDTCQNLSLNTCYWNNKYDSKRSLTTQKRNSVPAFSIISRKLNIIVVTFLLLLPMEKLELSSGLIQDIYTHHQKCFS